MDLNDILLDGETVLWQGAPDYTDAVHKPQSDRDQRRTHLLWVIILLATTTAFVLIGFVLQIVGFFGYILAVLVVVSGIAAAVTTGTYFNSTEPTDHRDYKNSRYVLTDRRLIVSYGPGSHETVYRNGVFAIELYVVGKVSNIVIHIGQDREIGLYALKDGPAAHRLIEQTLAPLEPSTNPSSKSPGAPHE
jgi:hypothetical protein